MASDPDVDYVYQLAGFSQLTALAQQLGPLTCDEATFLDPNDPNDFEDDGDQITYARVGCAPLPSVLTLTVEVLQGNVAVFASVNTAYPSPRNFDLADLSNASVRVLTIDRAALYNGVLTPTTPPVHVGILTLGASPSRYRVSVSASLVSTAWAEIYSVSETARVGAVAVPALNASIAYTYSILGGNDAGRFAINTATGTITVAQGLDFETTQAYRLLVALLPPASSGVPSCGTPTASIRIQVTDANDHAPYFHLRNDPSTRVQQYVVTVAETAATTSPRPVARVYATDLDTEENGRIVYSLPLNPPGWSVQASTGQLFTTLEFDFESAVTSYTLVVTATDQGVPALASNATVIIRVEDIKDQAPVFSPAVYTLSRAKVGSSKRCWVAARRLVE